MKRLFQKTLKTAATLRRDYAKGLIVPLCQGLLTAARALLARGLKLAIPPRVTPGEGREITVEPRHPGKSNFVACLWPDPFPPTMTDQKALVDAAVAAVTGKVMSRRTAVAWLATSPIPISDVEAELEAIEDDEEAAAERQQTMLGLGEPPEGKAGDPGGKAPPEDDNEEEAPASEKPGKEKAA